MKINDYSLKLATGLRPCWKKSEQQEVEINQQAEVEIDKCLFHLSISTLYFIISFMYFSLFFSQISKYLLFISNAQTIFSHVLILKKKIPFDLFSIDGKRSKSKRWLLFFFGRRLSLVYQWYEWMIPILDREDKKGERKKIQIIYACISCWCDCLTT